MESVLVVADWKVDPHAVVAAYSRHGELHDVSFTLLVPAVLHGLDWAGDPAASVPCAERQLAQIRDLSEAAGLPVRRALVGDPNAITAIGDVLLSDPVDELIVCAPDRLLRGHLLDLAHRAARATGIPTRSVAVPARRHTRRRAPVWSRVRRGHCAAATA